MSTNMGWKKDFEKEFEIVELPPKTKYKIIIGKQRYLQKLGSIDLAVSTGRASSLHDYYKDFPEVGFLVNKWIKIQDSLEMIFNLLTGNSTRALKMLSYLREKKVCVYEFANYLVEKRKLILINKYKKGKGKDELLSSQIIDLITKINKKETKAVSVLFVGDYMFTQKIPKFKEGTESELETFSNSIGQILHSSGVNLNKKPGVYYKTWYKLDDDQIEHEKKGSKDLSLSEFKVL